MSSNNLETLKRYTIAGIPIICSIIKKLGIKSILSSYLHAYGNEKVPVVDTLILLLCNITLGRQPLYELKQWVERLDLKYFDLTVDNYSYFNDDRFGRASDKLYYCDRASLLTEIVTNMIKVENLDLSRIHNDSTTIKAYGKYPRTTKTGFHLANGKSKDHRPDLKQLVFSLSISSDGAVPIHHKVYSGNRTDDTTHIETWEMLNKITGFSDFIYVADCKVCTSKQLTYIVKNGGRIITIMPKTWTESQEFRDSLRIKKKKKKHLWRRKLSDHQDEYETFSIFVGDYSTQEGEYRIYWYHSTEKAKTDRLNRQARLQKADRQLLSLSVKLNRRKLKTRAEIKTQIENILTKYKVKGLIKISVLEKIKEKRVQIGRGRPGPKTEYKIRNNVIYSLLWEEDEKAIKHEKNTDGIFPLLTTDKSLSAKEVLKYYKYQPKLEKRFMQFKSVHDAAPLLFKKVERVESIMFLFFLSLMIQAIIEREIRLTMKKNQILSLSIYPEDRKSFWPTTSKLLDVFEGVSSYQLQVNGNTIKEFRDALTPTQEKILSLLNISSKDYWKI